MEDFGILFGPSEAAPSANYNIPLLSFDKSILRSGSLQYVHTNNNNGHSDEHEDEFTVIVIVEFKDSLLLRIGPFSIAVHLLAKNQVIFPIPIRYEPNSASIGCPPKASHNFNWQENDTG